MNFSNFSLPKDIYLYFWIVYFKPIYDKQNTYANFININSKWADFSNYLDIKKITNQKVIEWKTTKILNTILTNLFLPKTKKSFHKL